MMRFGEKMELYNEYELISHSKLADCSMFIVDMVYRPMHLHKEMELCYILSGHLPRQHRPAELHRRRRRRSAL